MPRGVKKVKPVAEPKAEMVKIALELPPELHARVARAAKADERTVNVYIRRFLALNVDLIDPEGAEGGES